MMDLSNLCGEDGLVEVEKLISTLHEQGISITEDARFVPLLRKSPLVGASSNGSHSFSKTITMQELEEMMTENPAIRRALRGELAVDNFPGFTKHLAEAYNEVKDENSGKITSYIPGLSAYEENKWAVAFCSTDGQVATLGDTPDTFTLQSVMKPILYGITSDLVGPERIHRSVGREPSGFGFNKIALGQKDLPHNPLINTGAITVTSLVLPGEGLHYRFERCYSKYRDLGTGHGRSHVSFNNVVYLSERESGHRNYAIGHYLLNKGCIKAKSTGELMEVLDLYFQLCSIEVDTKTVAVMGASLANGGMNPFTGKQVISASAVQNVLSLMYSCGMYDYSGKWAFEIGLPAKSGVSGVILVVLPNIGSLAMWSPLLDTYGNSVRGVGFTRSLLARMHTTPGNFSHHPFSSLRDWERWNTGNSTRSLHTTPHPMSGRYSAVGKMAWKRSALRAARCFFR